MSEQEGSGRHLPVMVDEVLAMLEVREGGRYVDATVGDGGFAERLLELSYPDGRLLAVDWDDEALTRSRSRLARYRDRLTLVHGSYADLPRHLREHGWPQGADGVIVDLGVSTHQLGSAERGFSFSAQGPLDMRMDRRRPQTAADLVNGLPERELADLIYRYGEERASRRIARAIVARRTQRPLATTSDLREAVRAAGLRGRPGHDPATRTFQALRIAVNDELGELERFLDQGWQCLRAHGRLCMLSYHSLEDRLVKQAFHRWAASCLCPPSAPMCTCGWTPKVRLLVRKRKRPSTEEVARNPRARSAGLRAVERLEE